jgi:hypothetical protein
MEGLTVEALATAKGLSVEYLAGLGVTDASWRGKPAVRIAYDDERDVEVAAQFRLALGGDRFRFERGTKPVPYGLWRLATTHSRPWLFLVEGASDCWTLWRHDLPALGLPSASMWDEEWVRYLDGITIVYVIDEGDQGGETLRATLARSSLRERIRVVRLDGAKDPSELYLAGRDRFMEAISAAREAAVPLEGVAPPIGDLAATLEEVEGLLTRFVHFSDPAHAVAITLWIALTHCWEQFETLIHLILASAVKQSGKTRTFDVLEWLVPSPWRCERPSEAVVFRRIDRDHPTLMLDEYDAVFGDRGSQQEGLRAILNSGNRRGTYVSRVQPRGSSFDLVDFDIFCPKALAGIGDLPDTVVDRSIVIPMVRRAPGEPIERMRLKTTKALAAPIYESLGHHLGRLDLADVEPPIPDELGDRAADGWEPLLAIADAAGGSWPDRARRAAVIIHGASVPVDESRGITLLGDLRSIFTDRDVERLWTADVIEALVAIEESPWGDVRGKEVTPTYLAKLLRPFGIKPKPIRIGEEVQRGYFREDLTDAWSRYLPQETRYTRNTRYTEPDPDTEAGVPVTPVTPVTPSEETVVVPSEALDPDEHLTWTA